MSRCQHAVRGSNRENTGEKCQSTFGMQRKIEFVQFTKNDRKKRVKFKTRSKVFKKQM